MGGDGGTGIEVGGEPRTIEASILDSGWIGGDDVVLVTGPRKWVSGYSGFM